jgi:hypothetical protein
VIYNWKALAPTRPLSIADISSDLYVPRTGDGAHRIDALLSAGFEQPVAIFGPAGAGKSTELAALAKLRKDRWVGPLVRLDKLLPYSEATTVDDVFTAIAVFIVDLATERLGVRLSPELIRATKSAIRGIDPTTGVPAPVGYDLALAAIREVRSSTKRTDLGLLIDGLEKASPALALKTLGNLARLRSEAHVVVVVPTYAATGPSASVLHDYHVMSIGAVEVSATYDDLVANLTAGDNFLFEIGARRLGVPADDIGGGSDTTAVAMRHCIVWSGGLVRTFLQLLQKAALYAVMRGRATPDEEDVRRAAQDQTNFLLRLLKDGDVASLRAAHGKLGFEVEIDRRIRFLANGLLLEHERADGPTTYIAPLLVESILRERRHE